MVWSCRKAYSGHSCNTHSSRNCELLELPVILPDAACPVFILMGEVKNFQGPDSSGEVGLETAGIREQVSVEEIAMQPGPGLPGISPCASTCGSVLARGSE